MWNTLTDDMNKDVRLLVFALSVLFWKNAYIRNEELVAFC